MIVVSILLRAEFGPNRHREDAFHFIILGRVASNFILGELMWPVDPIAIKSLKFDNEIYLIVYSTISVDIFDVLKGTFFTAHAPTRVPALK